jgi:hypothetical protein
MFREGAFRSSSMTLREWLVDVYQCVGRRTGLGACRPVPNQQGWPLRNPAHSVVPSSCRGSSIGMGRPAAAVGRGCVSARRARHVDSTISAHWRLMSSVHFVTDRPCMKQLIHSENLTLSAQAAAGLEVSNGVWLGDENENNYCVVGNLGQTFCTKNRQLEPPRKSRLEMLSSLSSHNSIDPRNLLLFLSGKHKSPFTQRHSTSCTMYRFLDSLALPVDSQICGSERVKNKNETVTKLLSIAI